jgi:hypothetical protein
MFACPPPGSNQLAGLGCAGYPSQRLRRFVRCVGGLLLSGFYGVVGLNAQSKSPDQFPATMSMCEPDACGTWSFHGQKGVGKWLTGPEANLTIEHFDASSVSIRREDVGGTQGLKGQYTGTRKGDHVEGKLTWTWPGHGQLSSGNVDWIGAIRWKEEKSELPVPNSMAMCEGAVDGCTTWTFQGKLGEGRWPIGTDGLLTIEHYDGDSLAIRRLDATGTWQGLVALYTGTVKGDHIEGTMSWLWPGHGQVSIGTVAWSATIPSEQKEAGNVAGKPIPQRTPGSGNSSDDGPRAGTDSSGEHAERAGQAQPRETGSVKLPSEMNICAAGCSVGSGVTLVWDNGKYVYVNPTNGQRSEYVVEKFTRDSVVIQRTDSAPVGKALLTGQMSSDGNSVVNGKITWTYHPCCGLGSGTFELAWGDAIDSVPGTRPQQAAESRTAKKPAPGVARPAETGSDPNHVVTNSQPTPFKDSDGSGRADADSSGERGAKPSTPPKVIDAKNGSYYALVIGINNYTAPLPTLKTAVNDAQAVAKLLSERYGFQVNLLLNENATRANILKTLDQYRRNLAENDNLLIYYAGHGHSEPEADKAYWLPADAEADATSNWIIADELTTDIRVQPARHVLIISDSCYAGGLTRDAALDIRPDDRTVFLKKMLASKSRTLMASGGNEPVSDTGSAGHSVFASALLAALQKIDQDAFTAGDLFHNFIEQQVAGRSDQVPRYSLIRNSNHDDGDFVFTRKASAGRSP